MKSLLVLVLLIPPAHAWAGRLCFNIPDAQVARVLDGIAERYAYPKEIPNPDGTDIANPYIPNPQTKAEFARDIIRQFVRQSVVEWEAAKAGDQAKKAAREKAEREITVQGAP